MVLGEGPVADMIKGKAIVTNGSSPTVQAEEISGSTSDDEKKFSVLIVEDNSFTRILHRIMVTRLGLKAKLVEDGKKAVDLYRSGASFDLILMDRKMPVMDGVKATKELRAMGVGTVIVGVTADSEGPERQAFVEAGLNDCYTKPLNQENLAALVQVIKQVKEQNK